MIKSCVDGKMKNCSFDVVVSCKSWQNAAAAFQLKLGYNIKSHKRTFRPIQIRADILGNIQIEDKN